MLFSELKIFIKERIYQQEENNKKVQGATSVMMVACGIYLVNRKERR